MKKLIATNIEWDSDTDDVLNLPNTIEVPVDMIDEEDISNYISEQTGYCHNGFSIMTI